MAINYDKPCNVRIALFTLDGQMLDVRAKNVLERRSYEKLAKDNLKAMSPRLGPITGAVVVVDYDKQSVTLHWSKRGENPTIQKSVDAWLKKNGIAP